MYQIINNYKIVQRYKIPQIVLYKKNTEETILFIRCSMKLYNHFFVSVLFTLNTNYSEHFSMGYQLWNIFEKQNRFFIDDEKKYCIMIHLQGKNIKCYVHMNPILDTAIMGLPFFFLLGINFDTKIYLDLCFVDNVCRKNGITHNNFKHI